MGNGRIFIKISAPLSLMQAFRMNLISAGSTSLKHLVNCLKVLFLLEEVEKIQYYNLANLSYE
jgi:hypothetical protein